MADNPNPDHLRGWGAPIPDRLTPEERAAVECVRPTLFQSDFLRIVAALDRLAPKPAAEDQPTLVKDPVAPRCSFCGRTKDYAKWFVSGPSAFICDRCVSICDDIRTEWEAENAAPPPNAKPDPDREAREAAAHFWVYDDPACVGCIRRAQPADFRAHGFTHRSEGARNDFAACYRAMVRAQNDATLFADLLEAAWCVIANVSEGNWEKQPDDWRDAAARWRDRWLATIPRKPESSPPVAPPPAAVDVVREALNFCGYAGTGAAALTAALAARGVTFGEGNDADLLAFASWCHMRVQRPNAEDVAVWRATGGRAS